MRSIRIGSGAGFADDRIDPAAELAERGQLNYLVFECLAERTIALAQRERLRDPGAGFNAWLAERMDAVLGQCARQGIKVITNMGAANPLAAAELVADLGRRKGLPGLKVAAVTGDDVLGLVKGSDLPLVDRPGTVASLGESIVSANAYLGCEAIVAALAGGADVVITGRVADPSLYLAPLVREFGWPLDDWDLMGKGICVGHLLECAGQVTGGYFADPGVKDVPGLARLGFPIAQVAEDGSFSVTKVPGSGGRVTVATCTEQLLYEVHDPAAYMSADAVADFSGACLTQVGLDEVAVTGITGNPRPDTLKVSVGYLDGFIGEGEICYAGPGAVARGRLALDIVRERLEMAAVPACEARFELIGVDAVHRGPAGDPARAPGGTRPGSRAHRHPQPGAPDRPRGLRAVAQWPGRRRGRHRTRHRPRRHRLGAPAPGPGRPRVHRPGGVRRHEAASARPRPRRRQGQHLRYLRHRLRAGRLRVPARARDRRAGARALRRHRPRARGALRAAPAARAQVRAARRPRRRRHPHPQPGRPRQEPELVPAGDGTTRTTGATMSNDATATTTAGQVRGQEGPGGILFAGIPFAQPPVGPLRLRPPQPPEPWTGVREADTFPPAPAQGGTSLDPAGAQMAWANDEDCLYLNLFTPALDGVRPVIVWIYGGGFEVGTASPPMTDVAALARATGAVVVAMNYRVGALGWLYLAGLGGPDWAGSANLGLQDQIAALHWVHDNIAAFGGDPGSITVAGESAGAFCIGALLAAPAAAGTFHRAILSSGSTGRVYSAATATAIAGDLLAALGLSSVKELADVPVERLLATQRTVIESDIGRRNLPGGRAWGVVLDGSVLDRDPAAAVRAGAAARLPLLISTNRDETKMFAGDPGFAPADDGALLADIRQAGIGQPAELLAAYRARHPRADLTELRTRLLTDAVYVVPANRLAEAQVEAGGTAYRALFAADPFGPEVGTPHGMDLAYIFDLLDVNGMGTPASRAVRDDLHHAWRRYAETGEPGWPPYDPGATENTRLFGAPGGLTTEPAPDEVTAHWR